MWNQSQASGAITINNEGCLMNAQVYEGVCRDASNELLVLAEFQLSFSESICWRHFYSHCSLFKPQEELL